MSSGPDYLTTTQQRMYPDWVNQGVRRFGAMLGSAVNPGAHPDITRKFYEDLAPAPVAGLDPLQAQAIEAVGGMGPIDPTARAAAGEAGRTLSGQYLTPESNPALRDYYDAAARGMEERYRMTTEPGVHAAAVRAGALGSTGHQEQQAYERFNLGENLGNLAAKIYSPAYESERGRMHATAMGAPNIVGAQYIAPRRMMEFGQPRRAIEQEEKYWPFRATSFFGQNLGPMFQGSRFKDITRSPNPEAGGK